MINIFKKCLIKLDELFPQIFYILVLLFMIVLLILMIVICIYKLIISSLEITYSHLAIESLYIPSLSNISLIFQLTFFTFQKQLIFLNKRIFLQGLCSLHELHDFLGFLFLLILIIKLIELRFRIIL